MSVVYKILKLLPIGHILFLGLFIRIAVILLFISVKNFDLLAYEIIGKSTLQHMNIYAYPAVLYHPYFPFMLYLEALTAIILKYQVFFLKLLFALFDTGIIYLVYLLTKARMALFYDLGNRPARGSHRNKKRDIESSKIIRPAFLYAINPISIFITCIQGQFDSLPLFFLLLSIYFFNKNKLTISMCIFSFAVMIKTWPIFFILAFFKELKNKFQIIFVALFPLISLFAYSVLFKSNSIYILKTILWYRAIAGVWGISLIISLTHIPVSLLLINRLTIFIMLCFFAISYVVKRKTLLETISFLCILFFIITPVFGIQWLMWMVPFIFLTDMKGKKLYFLTTSLFIIFVYLQWFGFHQEVVLTLLSLASWLSIIRMFYSTFPISSILKVPSSSKLTR